MFYLTYLRQELRRRLGRTIFTVCGLAVGVALVIAVTALSAGLDKAQTAVLGPLAGVGTDMTVTKQNFLPGGLALIVSGGLQTDLSKLGKPGDHFSTDNFFDTQPTFDSGEPAKIASVADVQTTSEALVLRGIHQEGVIPKITATVQAGGQTVTQSQTVAPMTAAERSAFNACMAKNTPPQPTPAPGGGGGGGGDGEGPGGGGGRFAATEKCLPSRFSNQRFSFRTPLQQLRADVNTPQTDIQSRSFTVAGIDPKAQIGLITPAQVTSGRFLQSSGEALVSQTYATANKLKLGSTLTLKTTTFNVVGIIQPPLGGQAADIYMNLTDLQTVSGKSGQANIVLARASVASKVGGVSTAITNDVPGTNVANASDLAKQVAGSLVDSGNLIKRLGLVLALVGMAAAFLITILLTLSSIAKRTRELGTLKAIGWGRRVVARQIVAETMTQGLLGGILGIALGLGAAAMLGTFAPTLSARPVDNGPGGGGGRFFGLGRFGQQATQIVHLTAPVRPTILIVAAALAIVGGLIAGLIGAMRAARLGPADAMREVN